MLLLVLLNAAAVVVVGHGRVGEDDALVARLALEFVPLLRGQGLLGERVNGLQLFLLKIDGNKKVASKNLSSLET